MREVRFFRLVVCAGLLLCCPGASTESQEDNPPDSLRALAEMSLEDLANLEVSSVSKRAERRSSAAAAIFVITDEDIRRSSAVTFSDLLRMVPGLHVASLDVNKRSVSSRGFSGRYSNYLLVLIDGRSAYSPLFSGMEWEGEDFMLENIERVEIIRGPGGALWGANAVNGVINIVTKNAADTQGGLLMLGSGTEYPLFGAARYGATAGQHGHYRLHLRYLQRDDSVFDDGRRASDGTTNFRTGGRWDWDWGRDQLALIADVHGTEAGQTFEVNSPYLPVSYRRDGDTEIDGGAMVLRWTRAYESGAELRLQFSYTRWESLENAFGEQRDTFDFEIQHLMAQRGRHEILIGGGLRYYDDETFASRGISLDPDAQRKRLFSAFVQDRISFLDDKLVLTLGTKFEYNDFTGVEIQPSARIAWTPNERHTLWAAVSRAVRTPSLIEEAGRVESILLPGIAASLYGNQDFEAEELLAIEAGYRVRLTKNLHADLALFYNRYDKLRTVELDTPFLEPTPLPVHIAVPFRARNNLEAETFGAELALDWRAATWWRLRASYSYLETDLDLHAKSLDIISLDAEGSSPEQQVFLGSYMDLGDHVDLDIFLRYIDQLPALDVDSYLTMDVRLSWHPRDDFEVSVVGHNLLESEHQEYDSTFVNTVPTQAVRGIYGKLTWKF